MIDDAPLIGIKRIKKTGIVCGRPYFCMAISETYARDPSFYGATYCVGCKGHFPVGENGEFHWEDGQKVGS